VKDTKTVHQALQAIDDINGFIQALKPTTSTFTFGLITQVLTVTIYANRKPYGARVLLKDAIFE
jgi:hypothetical protein